MRSPAGIIVLNEAIAFGNSDAFNLLIASRCDPNVPDAFGYTALHTCVDTPLRVLTGASKASTLSESTAGYQGSSTIGKLNALCGTAEVVGSSVKRKTRAYRSDARLHVGFTAGFFERGSKVCRPSPRS